MGVWVKGLGFMVEGLGCRVWDLGCVGVMIQDSRFIVYDSGFEIDGLSLMWRNVGAIGTFR